MEALFQTSTWFILLTLIFLEVILGVDNIIFISIVSNKLPKENQKVARNLGMVAAFIFRVILLFGVSIIMGLDKPFYHTPEFAIGDVLVSSIQITGKSIILLIGGVFLIAKSTSEIFQKLEIKNKKVEITSKKASFKFIVIQIIMLDVIFSFDSILTAVGMVDSILVIIISMVTAMIIMMLFSGAVSRFINKFLSLQILALSFLILIGFTLLIEAVGKEVPKGYIYFAIFFSLIIELINIKIRKRSQLKLAI